MGQWKWKFSSEKMPSAAPGKEELLGTVLTGACLPGEGLGFSWADTELSQLGALAAGTANNILGCDNKSMVMGLRLCLKTTSNLSLRIQKKHC